MVQKTTKKGADFEGKKRWLKRYLKTLEKIDRLSFREHDLLRSQIDDDLLQNIQDHKKTLLDQVGGLYDETIGAINQLHCAKEREVLMLFFINGHSFKEIAARIHYSERQVIRYYVSGVNSVELKVVSEM